MNMDIELIFPSAPCQGIIMPLLTICIVFDFVVKTGYSEYVNENVVGISKVDINSKGEKVSRTTLEDALRNGIGCKIIGTTKIHKVPSTIYITTD